MKLSLLAVASLLSQVCLVTAGNSLYLYQNTADPIKEYTGTENDFTLSTNPRVVEFYSPHCPACIAFKPEYVELARRTQKEYSSAAVEFYAVSCDAQPKMCDEVGIDATPSMYVYREGSSQGKKLESDEEESDHRYTVELLAQELELTAPSVSASRRLGEDDDEDGDDGSEEDDDKASSEGDKTETPSEKQAEDSPDDDDEASNEKETGFFGEVADSAGDTEGEDDDDSVGDDKDQAATQATTEANESDGDDDNTEAQTATKASEEETTDAPDEEATEAPNERGGGYPANERGGGYPAGWKAPPAEAGYKYPYQYPQLGGAAVQRPHDAGFNRVRNEPKALDRFSNEMKMRREEYERKREGLGKFIRPDNRKDHKGNYKRRDDPHAMTKGMKAFTPGTHEHDKRAEAMKMRMAKAHKKMRIPAEVTARTPLRKDTLPYKKDVRKQGFVKKTASVIPVVGRRFRMTPEEELILDVSLSIVVGLETGVKYKHGEGLNEKQRKALRNYLDLLNVALPPEWGINGLVDELRRRFSFIIQSGDNLRRVLSEHPLPRRTWSSSCVSRTKGTMGFSCGFWKLLHVTAVGVAEQRGGLSLVETGMVGPQTKLFSPIDAADTIRDYMEQFFNCEPCRKNFVQNYDDCENNRRCDRLTEEIEEASVADWKELPLWLWDMHNEVSVRILSEAKQRAKGLGRDSVADGRRVVGEQIAVIWPNIETCFLCFNEDGTWDEAEVFKHLESAYWPDSILDPKSERLIHFEDNGSIWFGLFLWILMFAVLGVVYSTIGKTSPVSFEQGIYQARRMVTVGHGSKKERSN